MTVYPRQRLYDIDHLGYFSAATKGKLNNADVADFIPAFTKFIGSDFPIVPLGRGRLSLYFATRNNVTAQKKNVVMCPFTIFDLVNMVVCGGGTPTWVDSERGSPHTTLHKLQEVVDENTALVVITHYHTVNPEIAEIAAWLKSIGVPLFEDCAISLGGRVNGKHVGTFGDYGLFSFGLFKFIATYYGGAAYIHNDKERVQIENEISKWPKMSAKDLFPYVKKGVKFSTLTNRAIFNWFTFPLFRLGYLNNIQFIKKNAINDPSPSLVDELPDSYKRRPTDYQIRDWRRQLDGVLEKRSTRIKNAERYAKNFSRSNFVYNTHNVNDESDCFLNFPINVSNPEHVLSEIMREGFDASPYFYRNCANLKCFSKYKKALPNIDEYANKMIILPTYPGIPDEYIDGLCKAIAVAAEE